MGCIISSQKQISPVPSDLLPSAPLFRQEVIRHCRDSLDICIPNSSLLVESSANETSNILFRYLDRPDAPHRGDYDRPSLSQSCPFTGLSSFRLFSDHFFDELMGRNYLFREIFQSNQEKQLETLGIALTWFLSKSYSIEDRISQLMSVYDKHFSPVSITSHVFDVMGAFQSTMRKLLGKRFTPQMQHAWSEMFTNIIYLFSEKKKRDPVYNCLQHKDTPSQMKSIEGREKQQWQMLGKQIPTAQSVRDPLQLVPSVSHVKLCTIGNIFSYTKLCIGVKSSVESGISFAQESPTLPFTRRDEKVAWTVCDGILREGHVSLAPGHSTPMPNAPTPPPRLVVCSNDDAKPPLDDDTTPRPISPNRDTSRNVGFPLVGDKRNMVNKTNKTSERDAPSDGTRLQCPCQQQPSSSSSGNMDSRDCLNATPSTTKPVAISKTGSRHAWDPTSQHFVWSPTTGVDPCSDKQNLPVFSPGGCSTLRTDPMEFHVSLEYIYAPSHHYTPCITSESNPGLPVLASLPGVISPLSSLGGLEDPVASYVHGFHDFCPMQQYGISSPIDRGMHSHRNSAVRRDTNDGEEYFRQSRSLRDVSILTHSPVSCAVTPKKTLPEAFTYPPSEQQSELDCIDDQHCSVGTQATGDGVTNKTEECPAHTDTLILSVSTCNTVRTTEQFTSPWTLSNFHDDLNTIDSLLELPLHGLQRSDTSHGSYLSSCLTVPSPFPYLTQPMFDRHTGIIQTNESTAPHAQSPNPMIFGGRDKHMSVSCALDTPSTDESDLRLYHADKQTQIYHTESQVSVTENLSHTPIQWPASSLNTTSTILYQEPHSTLYKIRRQLQPKHDRRRLEFRLDSLLFDKETPLSTVPTHIDLSGKGDRRINRNLSFTDLMGEVSCTSEQPVIGDDSEYSKNTMIATFDETRTEVDPFRIKGGILQTMRMTRDVRLVLLPTS